MNMKSTSDSVRPDKIAPTLLFFAHIPCLGLPCDCPMPITLWRAIVIYKETDSTFCALKKRQVRDEMLNHNSPVISELHRTIMGSLVLIHVLQKNNLEGLTSIWMLEEKAFSSCCLLHLFQWSFDLQWLRWRRPSDSRRFWINRAPGSFFGW